MKVDGDIEEGEVLPGQTGGNDAGKLPDGIKKRHKIDDVVVPSLPSNKPVFLTAAQREALRKRGVTKIEEENNTARRLRHPPGEKSVSTNSLSNCSLSVTESADSTLRKLGLLDVDLVSDGGADRAELESLRARYLGITERKHTAPKRAQEKYRTSVNFEWLAAEDTTQGGLNVLYRERKEPQLLFGRGYKAGVDTRLQRSQNDFYDVLLKRRAAVEGGVLKEPNRARRRLEAGNVDDDDQLHWSEKPLDKMTPRDWRIFREDNQIHPHTKVPNPCRTWEESGLPNVLLQAVRAAGYEKPTPIQMQTIPIALQLTDLIGIAETGSGKTAAFILPMLAYINSLPRLNDETAQDGPYGLILAPSRELALQIDQEAAKFSRFCTGLRTIAIVGGHNAETQAFNLRRGCELVIGTPGRLRDCIEKQYTVLSQCCYVILDEADRMVDLNFEETLNWMLDQIPVSNLKSEVADEALQQQLSAKVGYRRYRVTQMFSATFAKAIEQMVHKYLRSPAYISIGDPGTGKKEIEQIVEFISEGRKLDRLKAIVSTAAPPVIVFVNLKKIVDGLVRELTRAGVSAVGLHGGKSQESREENLTAFKEGDADVLVATDVAGRGIDIDDVQLVINYDMPKDITGYTHRIGRTGRAGKKGRAVSFLSEQDAQIFYDLRQFLISTDSNVPRELENHPAAKVKPGANAEISARSIE